jgi:ABC-type nitrate/sulfonate/bicarbonate transport system substrate-binding protein
MNGQALRLKTLSLLMLMLMAADPSDAGVGTAPKTVTLLLDWYPEAENARYFYALTHGLYAQAGLNVQISPIGPNGRVGPQVASG